jgi:hypothetical protein
MEPRRAPPGSPECHDITKQFQDARRKLSIAPPASEDFLRFVRIID